MCKIKIPSAATNPLFTVAARKQNVGTQLRCFRDVWSLPLFLLPLFLCVNYVTAIHTLSLTIIKNIATYLQGLITSTNIISSISRVPRIDKWNELPPDIPFKTNYAKFRK